jgi:hypothetical protein
MQEPPPHEQAHYRREIIEKTYNSSVSSIFLTNGLFDFFRSNFFKKTKIVNPQDFYIKGLERSGTGFCVDLLTKNIFDINILENIKHNFLDNDPEYENHNIIICVKNPYSWYLSYIQYWSRDKFTMRNLEKHKMFCEGSHACGMIKMWNFFYNSCLNIPNKKVIIKYEDMLLNPENVIKEFASEFSLFTTQEIYGIQDYVNNYTGRHMGEKDSFNRKKYFLSKEYIGEVGIEIMNVITENLDENLLQTLGYSKES